MLRKLLALGLLTLATASVPRVGVAVSTVTDITPSNISSQPLTFRVNHEAYADGIIRFEVYVSAGSDAVSPNRAGRFVVWRERVVYREGRFHDRASRPAITAACAVDEDERDGVLRYEVQIHESKLQEATFMFLNYEPRGMPAFDGYEFILSEFVVSQLR
jgi:hypothetical protein